MRRKDIKPCVICGKGVMHNGDIAAYQVTVQQHIVDHQAVRRQAGLEMMLGNAYLAHVMGPNEELLKPVGEPRPVLMCQPCFLNTDISVAEVWEASAREPEEEMEAVR